MLSHARTAKAGASLHEVRSDATTGRRMRLHLPSGAARGAASGAVLHFVPDLWATSRLGAPNGAHCLAQSPAAGAKARLMAWPMVPSRMSLSRPYHETSSSSRTEAPACPVHTTDVRLTLPDRRRTMAGWQSIPQYDGWPPGRPAGRPGESHSGLRSWSYSRTSFGTQPCWARKR